jgi:sedoheptulose-bisphosphatase
MVLAPLFMKPAARPRKRSGLIASQKPDPHHQSFIRRAPSEADSNQLIMPVESGPTFIHLAEHLRSLVPSDGRVQLCTSVLPVLVDSISAIAQVLEVSQQVSLAGTSNAFGDEQLNVDVSAENIVRAALATCPSVSTASSEEEPIERPAWEGQFESNPAAVTSEQYTVAFDPLDGSSIIAANWTVGTIIGVWDGRSALHQLPAEKMVASVLGVYGSRTTVIVALRVPGIKPACFELGLTNDDFGNILLVRPEVRLADPPFKTRYFAPANLRAAAENPKYLDLITHYVQKKYTLRYSGGLVPDIAHMLVKNHGIYVSPVTAASKAKLRRLYELYPVALIIECAGGTAIDPADGRDILARALEDCDERAGLVCGTKEEVEFVKQSLLK